MIQCFSNGDPLCWVEGQQFPHEIQEVLVNDICRCNDFLPQKDENLDKARNKRYSQPMHGMRGRLSYSAEKPWALASPNVVLP